MRSPLVMLSLLALAAASACATSASRSSAAPLEDTYWRLAEVGGRPAIGAVGEREAHLQLGRDSARVVGSTGCNRLTGTYTSDGATLRFGPAATTRMACLEPQMGEQEQAFLAALQATERLQIVGDTLTLVGRAGPLARLTAVAK
jgi:heat shock protein HslJ